MNSIFKAAFEKVAITKMVKLVQQGRLPLASAAKATQKLNLKPRRLKSLGGGLEGPAELMTNPKSGLAVTKYYNISSPTYSKKLVNQKIKMQKKNPEVFAKYLGRKKNKPVVTSEFLTGVGQVPAEAQRDLVRRANRKNLRLQQGGVPGTGTELTPKNIATRGRREPLIQQVKENTKDAIRNFKNRKKRKKIVGDIHEGNYGVDASGNAKILDYLPAKTMKTPAVLDAVKPTLSGIKKKIKRGGLESVMSPEDLSMLRIHGINIKNPTPADIDEVSKYVLGKYLKNNQKSVNQIKREAIKGTGFDSKRQLQAAGVKPTEGFSQPVFKG